MDKNKNISETQMKMTDDIVIQPNLFLDPSIYKRH